MSTDDKGASNRGQVPKAMIHKKILDAARDDPDAAIETLADEVRGASSDLVERVLAEYGDPVGAVESETGLETSESKSYESKPDESKSSESNSSGSKPDTETPASAEPAKATSPTEPVSSDEGTSVDSESASPVDSADSESASPVEPDDDDSAGSADEETPDQPSTQSLDAKQRTALEAILARPNATQGELAADLDVAQSTVSQRLNTIEGFDWATRYTFAESVLDSADDETDPSEDPPARSEPAETVAAATTQTDTPDQPRTPTASQVDHLAVQVEALEEQVATLEAMQSERGDGGQNPPASEDAASAGHSTQTPFADPKLAAKVVRACLVDDAISEEEEDRIVEAVIAAQHAPATDCDQSQSR